MHVLEAAVLEALKAVSDPDLHRDIVTLGVVKDLSIDRAQVAFTIELTTPACPVKELMRDQARAAVLEVPGVSQVDVRMTARVREAVGGDSTRTPIAGVKNVIAVGAGKGGVSKTTAVNLALALTKWRPCRPDRRRHLRTNVPIACSMKTQLTTDGRRSCRPRIRAAGDLDGLPDRRRRADHLARTDAPRRDPAVFREVAWKDLDYLVVDMPPGTGDVALSLSRPFRSPAPWS